MDNIFLQTVYLVVCVSNRQQPSKLLYMPLQEPFLLSDADWTVQSNSYLCLGSLWELQDADAPIWGSLQEL
jgi:hypothetical protein